MSYKPLTKIYYSEPTKYESEYASRYNSSTTRHIPLELKPYNRSSSHKMFYCTPEDLVLLQDDILSAHSKLIQILTQTSHTENIPYALINQLELNVESHSRTLLCTQTTHPKSGQIVQESFQERFDQQDF